MQFWFRVNFSFICAWIRYIQMSQDLHLFSVKLYVCIEGEGSNKVDRRFFNFFMGFRMRIESTIYVLVKRKFRRTLMFTVQLFSLCHREHEYKRRSILDCHWSQNKICKMYILPIGRSVSLSVNRKLCLHYSTNRKLNFTLSHQQEALFTLSHQQEALFTLSHRQEAFLHYPTNMKQHYLETCLKDLTIFPKIIVHLITTSYFYFYFTTSVCQNIQSHSHGNVFFFYSF